MLSHSPSQCLLIPNNRKIQNLTNSIKKYEKSTLIASLCRSWAKSQRGDSGRSQWKEMKGKPMKEMARVKDRQSCIMNPTRANRTIPRAKEAWNKKTDWRQNFAEIQPAWLFQRGLFWTHPQAHCPEQTLTRCFQRRRIRSQTLHQHRHWRN